MLSALDADLVCRDAALPGLGTLLDREQFADMLCRCFPGSNIQRVQGVYFKYKPGMSCLAAYQAESAAGVVDIHARAYRPDAQHRFRRAEMANSLPGLLGRGQVIVPDRSLIVSVFPNDAALPALQPLTSPRDRQRLLRELLPDHPELWNARLSTLKTRAGKRYVAQLLNDDKPAAVLKIHSIKGYEAARINAQAFQSRGRMRVARLLAHSEQHRILVHEWLFGNGLFEAMTNLDFDPSTIAEVAAALFELHSQDVEGLGLRTVENSVSAMMAVATFLSFIHPAWDDRVHKLARRLADGLGTGPTALVPAHGDFSPRQVLLQGDTLGILDLDEAIRGDPAADLGLFISRLERFALQGYLPVAQVGPMKGALLEGYRAAGGTLSNRIEVYAAAGLLTSARHPFCRGEVDWPSSMSAALERAEALLANHHCSVAAMRR